MNGGFRVPAFGQLAEIADSERNALVVEYYGGAASRVAANATAFRHRNLPWEAHLASTMDLSNRSRRKDAMLRFSALLLLVPVFVVGQAVLPGGRVGSVAMAGEATVEVVGTTERGCGDFVDKRSKRSVQPAFHAEPGIGVGRSVTRYGVPLQSGYLD